MVSESINIILRYPSGFRKKVSGVYEDQVLYRVMNLGFVKPKMEAFELDYEDVGYEESGLGKFLKLPLYKKVVDVDFNAHSTMSVREFFQERGFSGFLSSKGSDDKKTSGKSIRTDCKPYPDDKKKDFYNGIAMGKWIIGEKKGFDLMSLGAGAAIGLIFSEILAFVIEYVNTQGGTV